MKKRAVFFDRDGVLNQDIGYLYKKADFVWMPNAIEAIRYINQKQIYVFVITNQSGIARGYYEEEDVKQLHQWMNEELAKYDAHIDDFFYCPHYEKGNVAKYAILCNCRKPKTGLIEQAFSKYDDIDRQNSIMIGDKLSDVECAENAGLRGIRYRGEDLLNLVQCELGNKNS